MFLVWAICKTTPLCLFAHIQAKVGFTTGYSYIEWCLIKQRSNFLFFWLLPCVYLHTSRQKLVLLQGLVAQSGRKTVAMVLIFLNASGVLYQISCLIFV